MKCNSMGFMAMLVSILLNADEVIAFMHSPAGQSLVGIMFGLVCGLAIMFIHAQSNGWVMVTTTDRAPGQRRQRQSQNFTYGRMATA